MSYVGFTLEQLDRRLASADVRGSIAYARAMRAGCANESEAAQIVAGWERKIAGEVERGEFQFRLQMIEIRHTAVERGWAN
jgi:argininosuccinate lyase